MRVLFANLRFFCQYRAAWLFYILIGIFVVTGLWLRSYVVDAGVSAIVPHASASGSTPLTGLMLICVFGLIVAAMQMEVVSRPFAFCLPGHQVALRGLVFVVGLVAALIVTAVWPKQDMPSGLFQLRFFCTGLVAYFISVRIGFIGKVALIGISFAPMLLFMSLLPLLDLSGRYFVLPPVVPAVTLSIATGTALWLWLGRTNLCRRYGGRPWLGLSGLNDIERDRYLEAVASAKPPRIAAVPTDGYLLRILKDHEQSSAAKHIWGALYAWSLRGGGSRQDLASSAFSALCFAILAWLMPTENASVIILMFFMSMEFDGRDLPIPANHLVAGGRWERFLTVMVLLIIRVGMLILSLTLGFAMMDWIGPHLPWSQARTKAMELGFVPMGLGFAVLLTAVAPLNMFLATVFPARRTVLLITLAGFGLFLKHGPWMAEVPFTFVLVAHLLSWSACAYGMYRIMMGRDLVRR